MDKLLFKRLALIVLGFSVVPAIELFMRLSGAGGHAPIVLEVGLLDTRQVCEIEAKGGQSYFQRSRLGLGAARQQTFFMPKDQDTVRILLAGESAVLGTPQPPPLTAGAFLVRVLEACWPDKRVEVLNGGTTAVASYPVYDIARQIMPYDVDLLIVYAGNNEFYGAYGVASAHVGGMRPSLHPLRRWAEGMALVQWGARRHSPRAPSGGANLMELMMAGQVIGPHDPRRQRAADQYAHYLRRLVRDARRRDIPVMLSAPAANERDLAPFGDAALSAAVAPETGARLAQARACVASDPSEALRILDASPAVPEQSASYFFIRAQALHARGDASAPEAFQRALDLDPMPWRPPSSLIRAAREVAESEGVLWCDVPAWLRARSPGGSIGWEWMDDHVHPTLEGQLELALAWASALRDAPGTLRVRPDRLDAIDRDALLAQAGGGNPYEAYRVAKSMESLFAAPFMQRSNPAASERAREKASRLRARIPPELASRLDREIEEGFRAHRHRSASAIAAYWLLEQGDVARAAELFAFAQNSHSLFSTARREYGYMKLLCESRIAGGVTEAIRTNALEEIRLGLFLLEHGKDPFGFQEMFVGRLYELAGDSRKATGHLQRAANRRPMGASPEGRVRATGAPIPDSP